jgi:hypothetical protein
MRASSFKRYAWAEMLPARRRANAALLIWVTLILLGASL